MALAVGIVSWSSITSATVSFTTCSMWGRAGTVAAKGTQDSPPAPVSPPPPPPQSIIKILLWQWHTALQSSFYNAEILMDISLALVGPSLKFTQHTFINFKEQLYWYLARNKRQFSLSPVRILFSWKRKKKIKIQTSNSLLWRVQGNKHVNTANFWSYVNPTEVETQLHYTNIRFSRM